MRLSCVMNMMRSFAIEMTEKVYGFQFVLSAVSAGYNYTYQRVPH